MFWLDVYSVAALAAEREALGSHEESTAATELTVHPHGGIGAHVAKISKLEVSRSGLIPAFVRLLKDWIPPKLGSETAYRYHLVEFPRSAVPEDARVEREFRHHGTTVDVYVQWKGFLQRDDVAFELKKDLQKKSDFDRLVGQIEVLDPQKHNVLVILIGNTDDALLRRLKEKYASRLDWDPLLLVDDDGTLAFVTIRPGGRRAKKEPVDSDRLW